MNTKSLDDVLNEFKTDTAKHEDKKNCPLTIWVPETYKARYDKLQKNSRRGFCKKLKELVLIAIEKTDSK